VLDFAEVSEVDASGGRSDSRLLIVMVDGAGRFKASVHVAWGRKSEISKFLQNQTHDNIAGPLKSHGNSVVELTCYSRFAEAADDEGCISDDLTPGKTSSEKALVGTAP
jgi:hypothetical protein